MIGDASTIARSAMRAWRRTLFHACAARCAPLPVTPEPAVVVAPHPDDEVFGAGGLIAAKCALAAPIRILYLTGGGASHRNCCAVEPDLVVARRRELAIRAASVLGVKSPACTFMDLPDGCLPASAHAGYPSAVSSVAEILDAARPAEIYCTHSLDGWQDHAAASAIVRAAARTASPGAAIFEYLVWAPLSRSSIGLASLPWRRGTCLKIGPWANLKSEAVRCYLSSYAPCGHPWVGHLPPDFTRLFDWPGEVFLSVP